MADTAVRVPHQPDTPSPPPRTAVPHGRPAALLPSHQAAPSASPHMHTTYTLGQAQREGNGRKRPGLQGWGSRHAPAVAPRPPSVGYFMSGIVPSQQWAGISLWKLMHRGRSPHKFRIMSQWQEVWLTHRVMRQTRTFRTGQLVHHLRHTPQKTNSLCSSTGPSFFTLWPHCLQSVVPAVQAGRVPLADHPEFQPQPTIIQLRQHAI